ncbi:MAG: hypothetical protein JXB33_05705 [Clostridia bacterium]|nr:hypothetical protein [Clostridia bacterium]
MTQDNNSYKKPGEGAKQGQTGGRPYYRGKYKKNTSVKANTPEQKKSTDGSANKGAVHGNRSFVKKNYSPRKEKPSRNPAFETIGDIKRDIQRIEKEIRLEIEEIKSIKV